MGEAARSSCDGPKDPRLRCWFKAVQESFIEQERRQSESLDGCILCLAQVSICLPGIASFSDPDYAISAILHLSKIASLSSSYLIKMET